MKKGLTEMVFILDRSGSMAGLVSDTIGGFNGMIEKQKKEEGEALVTTVLFSNESKIIHDRIDLREVPAMTEKEYAVGGCTALIDSLGETITHIEKIHKYIRPEDLPERTLFVITTDGYENASHRYTADEVRKMVARKKEADNWEFLFLGANIDAVETARGIGIDEDHSVNFVADSAGMAYTHAMVCEAASAYRGGSKIGAAWKKKAEKDYQQRKKK